MGRTKKPNDTPPKSKGKKRPPPKVVVCPFCQKVGHKSRNSKECGRSFRKPKNAAEPVPGTSTEVQCASCGEYGHRRASYSKCKNHQPRAAQQSTGLSKKDRDTYSIKCGFRSICQNQLVFDLVNQDVPNRVLRPRPETMDAQPDIRVMMMHLTLGYTPNANNRQGRQFYSLFAEYRYIAMRDVHSGGPLYENIHRGPLYDQACAEFTRNFATNVTTHARVRVRNYLIKIVGMARTDAYDSVHALFETNARPVIIEDAESNPFNDFDDLDFTEIDTKWWKFVGFYQRLQQRMLEPATEEVQQRDTERRAAAEVRRLAMAERAREREARNRDQKDIHIVIADEFRTTINCSQCNRKCTKISTGRDRYLYCAPCGITWNRDVNAGHNILNLGLVRNGLVPDGYMPDAENFSRSQRVAQ